MTEWSRLSGVTLKIDYGRFADFLNAPVVRRRRTAADISGKRRTTRVAPMTNEPTYEQRLIDGDGPPAARRARRGQRS
jgi:hypothetical protein